MTFSSRFCLVVVATLVACTKSAPAPAASDSAGAKPSSEANVAALKAYVDAWNNRDSVGVNSLLAPGGIHEDISWGFRGVGPAQINGFMRDVLKVQPDYKWNAGPTFAEGSHVAMEWTWTATYTGPSPTGATLKNVPVSGRGVSIVEFENGKIKHLTDYYDAASFFPKDTTRK